MSTSSAPTADAAPSSDAAASRRLPIAILALAIAAFAIGSTEFTIIGLLPEVAEDLEVSIPTAGLLVSGYAIGVVIGAPLMTAAGTKVRRHRLLLILMAIFTVGNVLSAIAPSYGLLLVSRVLSALPHGAFFGVASVVAAELVPPHQRHKAVATMFTGLAMSNVVGVPLGTLLGQELGWRVSFWVIALLGVLSAVAILRLIPPMSAGSSLRNELAAFRRVRVWLVLAIIVFGFGGLFTIVGYIKPLMTDEAGLSANAVLPVLAVLGLGMVLGTRLVDPITRGRRLSHVVPVMLTLMVGVLLLFVVGSSSAPVAILLVFLLGAVAFAGATPMQAMAMDVAREAPTLTSAAAQGAFNLGNALGPALGGLAINAGFGYAALGWVGAAIGAVGVALALLFVRLQTRDAAAAAAVPPRAAGCPAD
ncbi:MFS transporter [Patulibacter americanus]|uniref:MFS transporter n=1 Tax=Patulibacter americanus TaxID=588672 RepID=UPI0003B60C80|nr:MFS transporter [Patulibacter americanus]